MSVLCCARVSDPAGVRVVVPGLRVVMGALAVAWCGAVFRGVCNAEYCPGLACEGFGLKGFGFKSLAWV